ncbi:Stk1 family PASTA domain-containing Ser/Thr kinase [Corynebacterium cystitidis]|uniref:Stk1 family PASTA domain-containing Ser/Thr kinase n=1 Tax=Corynebacterium cystitidis TaxID=35757 RepID=UPI00211EB3F4|nr:Stk1 family PASTA domain-containing Ser/Thr kinase [Corynebacterium cystitidis]
MSLLGDRYQLGESIGTGGMSDVYAATDTMLGREIAIKMLKVDMARDEIFRERFRREAQNSARLNHPNIVAVYDTGTHVVDGVNVPYIVMERVIGRDLRAIVRDEGPLTPEAAAELLSPVTAALQASHDAGIIHRDVKPANIMVTNTGAVKVMDFGIARALDDSTAQMTQTSAVIGTAQYLSPEQARGKPVDGRSDIYALGCVMYEAVTGRPPFEGETPFAVAYQHVQEEAEEPSAHIPGLSPQAALNVDAVVLTAMAKHPADRYQTATEMGEDLQRLARGAVTSAARSHVALPAAPPADAESATQIIGAPATGAAGAAGAAGVGMYDDDRYDDRYDDGDSTRYARHREENSSKGTNWLKWIAALLALVVLGFAVAFAADYFRTEEDPTITETMITLPDVTGVERGEAVSQLEDMGLQVQVNEEPNPDVPRNHVIRTNPTAGSQLREGTLVTLTVSSGREITDVPDITDMTPQEAAQALQGAGLELDPEVDEENSDSVEEGRIIRQSPVPGSQLSKGSTVKVVVSVGPELVRIPSLVGMNSEQAESILSSLGLSSKVEEVDSERPAGEVLAVAGEGTEVAPGTTVSLQVSNGMLMEMIDITRMTPAQATTALQELGWTGTFREGPAATTGALIDEGLIASQQPKADTTIRKDATVTISLWRFDARELLPTGPLESGARLAPDSAQNPPRR